MIEDHAEELTRGVLDDLARNPRIPADPKLSPDELHRRTYDAYHSLGRWLGENTETAIDETYSELGRRCCNEAVPLSQVVQALIPVKDHHRQYVLASGLVGSALELYGKEELNLMVGHFFDKATYFVVRGYEAEAGARAGESWVALIAAASKRGSSRNWSAPRASATASASRKSAWRPPGKPGSGSPGTSGARTSSCRSRHTGEQTAGWESLI